MDTTSVESKFFASYGWNTMTFNSFSPWRQISFSVFSILKTSIHTMSNKQSSLLVLLSVQWLVLSHLDLTYYIELDYN